jgi:hypothetical protein
MANTIPIQPTIMYRNILGRVNGFRGNRIVLFPGTIVDVPFVPLDHYEFRNLMAKSLLIAPDGKPAHRVYFSNVGATQNAFEASESNVSLERLISSTYVLVRPPGGNKDGSDDRVCLHVIGMGAACPGFDRDQDVFNFLDPDDILFDVNWGDCEIVSVTDDEDYELTEDTHYVVTEDGFIITEEYLMYHLDNPCDADDDEEPECRTITILLDNNCDPIVITICPVCEEDADDVSDDEEAADDEEGVDEDGQDQEEPNGGDIVDDEDEVADDDDADDDES